MELREFSNHDVNGARNTHRFLPRDMRVHRLIVAIDQDDAFRAVHVRYHVRLVRRIAWDDHAGGGRATVDAYAIMVAVDDHIVVVAAVVVVMVVMVRRAPVDPHTVVVTVHDDLGDIVVAVVVVVVMMVVVRLGQREGRAPAEDARGEDAVTDANAIVLAVHDNLERASVAVVVVLVVVPL